MLSQMVEELWKIVLEHYGTLTNLISGSASVEPLKFGVESSSSSISRNRNSLPIYWEVENNSVSYVINDASSSILADAEGDSSTPVLHLYPNLTIKGKEMTEIVFLDL